jgi:hypothetical protein
MSREKTDFPSPFGAIILSTHQSTNIDITTFTPTRSFYNYTPTQPTSLLLTDKETDESVHCIDFSLPIRTRVCVL